MPSLSQPDDSGARPNVGHRNLVLLVQLRWVAVGGQLVTILAVHYLIGTSLPLIPMLAALAVLALLNVMATRIPRRRAVSNLELFCWLLTDVAVLTNQLFLSGGASNPFITLYLLQVVLGAILLESWSSWTLVAATSLLFGGLAFNHRPLALPDALASRLSPSYLAANWFNYTLAAVLLVFFVTRSNGIVRARDAHLAELRQRAAEEEHIVRMGLLASGAAHELGTPLSSLSVALRDWEDEPAVATTPALLDDVRQMRAEVARCKQIVGRVLFAAGEVTGEAPVRTTLRRFLEDVVNGWSTTHDTPLRMRLDRAGDLPIIADRALAQALVSLLDNAVDAGASTVSLIATGPPATLELIVIDDGTGFAPEILADIGRPYRSTKASQGSGLGLFLSTNVLRTLGGTLSATNGAQGGAEVTLRLPTAVLAADSAA